MQDFAGLSNKPKEELCSSVAAKMAKFLKHLKVKVCIQHTFYGSGPTSMKAYAEIKVLQGFR